jgi:hypothetical protein
VLAEKIADVAEFRCPDGFAGLFVKRFYKKQSGPVVGEHNT